MSNNKSFEDARKNALGISIAGIVFTILVFSLFVAGIAKLLYMGYFISTTPNEVKSETEYANKIIAMTVAIGALFFFFGLFGLVFIILSGLAIGFSIKVTREYKSKLLLAGWILVLIGIFFTFIFPLLSIIGFALIISGSTKKLELKDTKNNGALPDNVIYYGNDPLR